MSVEFRFFVEEADLAGRAMQPDHRPAQPSREGDDIIGAAQALRRLSIPQREQQVIGTPADPAGQRTGPARGCSGGGQSEIRADNAAAGQAGEQCGEEGRSDSS